MFLSRSHLTSLHSFLSHFFHVQYSLLAVRKADEAVGKHSTDESTVLAATDDQKGP